MMIIIIGHLVRGAVEAVALRPDVAVVASNCCGGHHFGCKQLEVDIYDIYDFSWRLIMRLKSTPSFTWSST